MHLKKIHTFLFVTIILSVAVITYDATDAIASTGYTIENERVQTPPMSLEDALRIKRKRAKDASNKESEKLPFNIRQDALKEAALSYGARSGLAWRTYYINEELEMRARYMDKVFDFRKLLIPAPSGLLIEPPIINQSTNNMLIEGDGQQAAVSDAMYNIAMNARIVSAPRLWRNYLEREWSVVAPPPDVLFPKNAKEQNIWDDMITKGWDEGTRQADEIFEEDLNLMLSDFRGMIRYRQLLAQGMVSPPYALLVDRGVTGDSNEMRVGDRAVQITGKPELITGHSQWQPASQ